MYVHTNNIISCPLSSYYYYVIIILILCKNNNYCTLNMGRNTLLFESKNNNVIQKRKPRTQGLREAVTNNHRVFTALARSGPNSCKTKSRA